MMPIVLDADQGLMSTDILTAKDARNVMPGFHGSRGTEQTINVLRSFGVKTGPRKSEVKQGSIEVMAKEHWINNELTEMTMKEAVLKLIDANYFLMRYSNPHDKWTDAVNIGIEAIQRCIEATGGKTDVEQS